MRYPTRPLLRFTLICGVFAAALLTGAYATQDISLRSDPIEQYRDALRESAKPLNDADDLDPLLERIGEARGVLLGEASHGTREFYTWRATISKRLIEEKDFSFIAVEGDWSAFARVNRYVKDLPGAADSGRDILKSFNRWPKWMWANEEVLELVEWLREYNLKRPMEDRIGFYGIDIYGYAESLEKGPRYLRAIDEEAAATMEDAFDCLKPYAESTEHYVRAIIQQNVDCEEPLSEVVEQLRNERGRLQKKDREAFFHAKQNALVVKSAERHQRTMLARDQQSWNARAEHFHQTFERLLEHYGDESRGIVWAHNTHIGDARQTAMGQQGMVNIGQLTRESMGDETVVLVGFGTHRGEVLAGRQWGGPRQSMRVPRGLPGSLEDVIHQLGKSSLLLITRELPDEPILRLIIPHRAIGVTYSPINERGNYVPTIFPRRYDAFIFIDETTALSPLHEQE